MHFTWVVFIVNIHVLQAVKDRSNDDCAMRLKETEDAVRKMKDTISSLNETVQALLRSQERTKQELENKSFLNATLQTVLKSQERTTQELTVERMARPQMEKHFLKKQGLSTRQSCEETEVAFFAFIGSQQHLSAGQIAVFDQVTTNIDTTGSIGGYSASTGVFTAPVDGLYVISATLMAHYNHAAHYNIVHENKPVATILVDGSNHNWDSASTSVALVLSKGERVSVKQLEVGDHALQGSAVAGESSFSGFLLHQHLGGLAPIG
ncbi:uncharacterized protein LOC127832510 [Dreissena polymorpha]|uniref:C1q domain-containing protein n=1 Tax=Dreissena polymorpha TaxID=45954 RepID=A0A9D4GSM9_DREPO|nr:uncharacterized protein LOC127832510 [Dreissena polymorpha]KAH3821113.1 hypothetical protein DPMN_122873 [Dreissena polymorpha]